MPLLRGASRCLPMLCKEELSWPHHLLQQLHQTLCRLKEDKWLPAFHHKLPASHGLGLMNLFLILDFKTFGSFLLVRTLEPKANLSQLVIKRSRHSIFWSCLHLNSSQFKCFHWIQCSHLASVIWDDSNGDFVFRGVTVTDTCHDDAEIFHSEKPHRILWVTEMPQIAATPQSCLSYKGLTFNYQEI